MSCPYANALGVPGEGVHAPRIFGYARNDITATIIIAIITSYIFGINIVVSLVGWFVLGEVLHYVYGVNTQFLKTIGMEPNCDKNG
jgi:hypothetical protein